MSTKFAFKQLEMMSHTLIANFELKQLKQLEIQLNRIKIKTRTYQTWMMKMM